MKLKYYLRGAGTGVLIATLILLISGIVHPNTPSRETIIKEAKKLGMVMPEETKKDSLWSSSTEVSTEQDESDDAQSDDTQSDDSQLTDTQPTDTQQEMVTITIKAGDYPRQVGEMLYDAGLVDDAEAFRVYLGERGYADYIAVGTHQIPKGATYEEICGIIIMPK